jgi:AcrR family transcriptional regulator
MRLAPQQARALATRERLVDAARAQLEAEGLRGTTTVAVATRAGVSQGALFKHFATKTDLLVAAAEAALAALIDGFRSELAATEADPLEVRVRAAVAGLWRVFRRPAMQGLFELYLAARTDEALGAALQPLMAAHHQRIHLEAGRCLPELAGLPALTLGVDAVVFAMQGVALGLFTRDAPLEADLLGFFERLALHALNDAGA